MDTMKSLIGKAIKIGDRDGEISNILGVGYEITFFNLDDGKTYVDSRDIEKYLVNDCPKPDKLLPNTEKTIMKRMTSEIIKSLQMCVDKHGDMPFELRDNETGSSFCDVHIFADTINNGGCCDMEQQTIGIAFFKERDYIKNEN